MTKALLILLAVCCFLVFHTYVLYPILVKLIAKFRRKQTQTLANDSAFPTIAVLIAAYNEEKVIEEKLKSVLANKYPSDKLSIFVGSDASTDATDALVLKLRQHYPQIHLRRFEERVGKITIINQLQSMTTAEILVLTDANVMFAPNCIEQLVKNFSNEKVGLIAANIQKVAVKQEGITKQESFYLSVENSIKDAESKAWQLIMGAEGGCYAIRNSLFKKVPANFIVDDFYITLQLLQRKHLALFEKNAVCYEDVAPDEKGEYRRKVRISAGNFQNLLFFKNILAKPFSALGFAFWSHKVLRWLSPFFLLIIFMASLLLSFNSSLFLLLSSIQLFGFLMPAFNAIIKFRNDLLKFIAHFYLMNLALLVGFVRFTKGISSSVWQPVKRDV